MIVIGDRGLGGFTGLLLGSTAAQMISHSHGPVAVVRGNTVRTGNVVAGVDGSASSLAALKFAAAEARRRGVDVEAVLAWSRPRPASPGDLLPLVYEPAAMEHEARAVMSEATSAARAAYPDVRIIERLVHGRARRTLVDCSTQASLLIVGRHTHEFGSLGSVAGALTHHAYCPVVVVPTHDLRAQRP
jgi:nucleotide-binding universal stress UspA family protein